MSPIWSRPFRYKQGPTLIPIPQDWQVRRAQPRTLGVSKGHAGRQPRSPALFGHWHPAPKRLGSSRSQSRLRTFWVFLCRVRFSENTSQEKTHLSSSSPSWNSPISAGFLGGKRRDVPPNGVFGGKKRGFFRKRFRLSILASRSRSSCLWGTRKWFIQFLFFGEPVFFETREKDSVNDKRGGCVCWYLADFMIHRWPRTPSSLFCCGFITMSCVTRSPFPLVIALPHRPHTHRLQHSPRQLLWIWVCP